LDARYRFVGNSASIDMTDASIEWRDAFTEKYGDGASFEKQACYICGGSEFEEISQIDRYGFWYPTGLCLSCGNVQQTSYYTALVLGAFYENYYRHIYGNQSPEKLFADQYQHAGSIHEIVTSHLGSEQYRVLEVGTGAGGILKYFADRGYRVSGIDFDDEFIAYGAAKGLDLHVGGVDTLPEGEKYDCIILSHVLEHIVGPIEFLESLAAKLTPAGCLYIEVPSLNGVRAGSYDCDLLKFYQNAHVIHFSTDSFANLCAQSGLDVNRIDPSIRAIVTANNGSPPRPTPVNHVALTRTLLRDVESRRTGVTHRVRRVLRHSVKNTASVFLARVGLREIVRSALGRKA
jgi:SAM-dependent methyltransferase